MCVDFFTHGISMKPIFNPLVGHANIVFIVLLEPSGTFVYDHVMSTIPVPHEVVV